MLNKLNGFEDYIKAYVETKDIAYEFVDYILSDGVSNKDVIFRGDCTYPSFLKEGSEFRFHNVVASFTTDRSVAMRFIKTECAPDWYFEEKEWCRSYPYPFTKSVEDGEELVSVIFVLQPNDRIKGIDTSTYDFSQRFNEKEFVIATDDLVFIIERVVVVEGVHLVGLKVK